MVREAHHSVTQALGVLHTEVVVRVFALGQFGHIKGGDICPHSVLTASGVQHHRGHMSRCLGLGPALVRAVLVHLNEGGAGVLTHTLPADG